MSDKSRNAPPKAGSSVKKDEHPIEDNGDEARLSAILGRMGPPLKIETPEELWDAFVEYVEARIVTRGYLVHGKWVAKPLTVLSFLNHLGIVSSTWYSWRNEKSDQYRQDLSSIIARIEGIIRDEQISGAVAGAYKENIVARLNGLKDQTDATVKVSKTLKDFYDDAGDGAVETTDA